MTYLKTNLKSTWGWKLKTSWNGNEEWKRLSQDLPVTECKASDEMQDVRKTAN